MHFLSGPVATDYGQDKLSLLCVLFGQVAELVTVHGLLRMLVTVDGEILNAGSNPVLTTTKLLNTDASQLKLK